MASIPNCVYATFSSQNHVPKVLQYCLLLFIVITVIITENVIILLPYSRYKNLDSRPILALQNWEIIRNESFGSSKPIGLHE